MSRSEIGTFNIPNLQPRKGGTPARRRGPRRRARRGPPKGENVLAFGDKKLTLSRAATLTKEENQSIIAFSRRQCHNFHFFLFFGRKENTADVDIEKECVRKYCRRSIRYPSGPWVFHRLMCVRLTTDGESAVVTPVVVTVNVRGESAQRVKFSKTQPEGTRGYV